MRGDRIVAAGRNGNRARLSRWLRTVAGGVLLVGLSGSVAAHAAGRAALIVDANTNQDLYVRDAERPLYPASLTKMMTLYIVFDLMAQKRISNATKIEVTERCANQPPSNLDLQAGDMIPLREAVLALIVKSANDVACSVGENLAGTEDKFAQIMTAKARSLGMKATTFRNASGLPDPGQVTTARDLATLALRLSHDFPEQYKLFATREFTFNGRVHHTHNGLLRSFEGTDGIKTGYTRASGFNLVSSVRRGQKHVIGVVMGGVTAAQRNATMRALLTQGLASAKSMSRPLVAHRPVTVPEPAAIAYRSPVPRRVADAGDGDAKRDHSVARPPITRAAAIATPATPAQGVPRPHPETTPRIEEPAAVPHPVGAAPAGKAGQGRPPSSLQEQASVAAPVGGAMHAAGRPSGLGARAAAGNAVQGPFHVQIGAFSNESEARRQLGAVAERAGTALVGHAPVTVPFAKASQQFYRARFAGFSEAKAQSVCQSLKAQRIECLVMRAE